jgi:hypothetical protein
MGEERISGGESPSILRLTVAEAASKLRITEAAVRSRIQRGTLRSYREDGRVYVVLTVHETRDESHDETSTNLDEPPDESTAQSTVDRVRDELIEELRDRVRALEDANRENRRIIAALTQRIPEIEPPTESPPEPREAPEPDSEEGGKGGYVLLPPSYVSDEKGAGSYVALNKLPAAPMPEWLVNLACKKADKRRRPDKGPNKKAGSTATPVTGPIPSGRRNAILASVAGKLHDGRTLEELSEALGQVNREKCEPPLPEGEVWAIVRSIYRLEPCTPKLAAPEVLEVLGGVERAMESDEARDSWKGIAGRTDYDVLNVILAVCARHGKLVKDGVWFSLSVRQLSEKVNSHHTSAANSLRRLVEKGWLKDDPRSKGRGKANSYILKRGAQLADSHRLCSNYETPLGCCPHLARHANVGGLGYPPPLRWSCPGYLRLGRTCGRIIKALYLRGGEATLKELAEVLGSRPRDVRRRYVDRLESRAIVEVEGDAVSLVEGWTQNLEIERGQTKEFEAADRTRQLNEYTRVAFRDFLAGNNKLTVTQRSPGSIGPIALARRAPMNAPEETTHAPSTRCNPNSYRLSRWRLRLHRRTGERQP